AAMYAAMLQDRQTLMHQSQQINELVEALSRLQATAATQPGLNGSTVVTPLPRQDTQHLGTATAPPAAVDNIAFMDRMVKADNCYHGRSGGQHLEHWFNIFDLLWSIDERFSNEKRKLYFALRHLQ